MSKKENQVSVRKVAAFTKISLMGSGDVVYTQGDQISVKVVGKTEEINRISTTVVNGTLKITTPKSTKKMNTRFRNSTKVYVTSPDLIEVSLQGCGDFEAKQKIDSDNFTVTLNGAGDIDLNEVICDNFRLKLRGAGDIDVKNLRCTTSNIELRGTGNVEVNQNKVNRTDVSLNGVGDIKLNMNQCGTANCKLSGVGGITLSGSVKQLNKRKSGIGSIRTSKLSVGSR